MELIGEIGEKNKRLTEEIFVACGRIESQMKDLPASLAWKCLVRLYNDLSAVTGGLVNCAQIRPASSQVIAALFRTLMESCISVFAFCKDPDTRSALYWDYDAVLDWRFVLVDESHIGCPYVPNESAYLARLNERKDEARRVLAAHGGPYVKGKKGGSPCDLLRGALTPGSESAKTFRATWYPETRKEILEAEGMEWAYDVLYTRLCSSVHSDSGASKVFAGLGRDSAVFAAMQWFGAAVFRMIETFRLHPSAEHKKLFSVFYESLRDPRKAS